MKKRNPMIRVLSVVLVLCMVLSASPVAYAWSFSDLFGSGNSGNALSIEQISSVDADVKLKTEPVENKLGDSDYADTDMVRVSIVLKEQPTLVKFASKGISVNQSAVSYRQNLQQRQAEVTAAIERRALGGQKLDVVWNLTLAANIISANVPYGSVEDIAAVTGVQQVVLEQQYAPLTTQTAAQPFQSNASGMIGANTVWAAGYTGAGSRVAIIDTGLDTDHQSFDAGAFLYALEQQAEEKGMDADSYIQSLDLLDQDEVKGVLEDLNIYPFVQYNSGTANGAWYVNEKVPFALNYVDRNYRVTHDYDAQGGHGSHVAGIAAANRYIPEGAGYASALDTVLTQGIAPDAQILVMKVFGEQGGAYDSDYMVAIEDAIWLGCDVVNLSLGANKGFARNRLYQDILDSLTETDTVVAIAGGNSGAWADYSGNGMAALYGDDVDFSVIGSPATATNSLSVASVENNGTTDYYLSVGDTKLYYTCGVVNNAYTTGLSAIGGQERTYVVIDGIGTAEEAAAAAAAIGDPSEAIMVCYRGEISFFEKANNAADAGFAGCIIANNVEGTINMDLTDYVGSGPCVSVSMADGIFLKEAAEAVADGLYVGTMYVSDTVASNPGSGPVTMSSYSSWGIPGSLEMKPEITAPGGNIYSVDGEIRSGDAYKNLSGTSMAAPQVAGMSAALMQYIREEGLAEKTGLSQRVLATSLLMATAKPVTDSENGGLYSILQQGAGLANLADAMNADSYILMDDAATSGAADGKVKVELGDDPAKTGVYSFGFTIGNFSDRVRSYSLSSDFFTQGLYELDGVTFHDTATVDLPVDAAFTVDAEALAVSSAYGCDLNGDGLTDTADARIILEHDAGVIAEIDGCADLNGDGSVDSYDAHLLLASLKSDCFVVLPGEEVHVQVELALTDKEALEAYVSGAYIEGFVTVTSTPDVEGTLDSVYSIPVLGFYGNWSDGSMYDRADYTDYIYNDYVFPYTGGLNYLSMFYRDGVDERYFVGNPYLVEETFPADRAAMHPETELGDMAVTLIRNAAGFLFYVLDGQGNVVDARFGEQLQAAYYYEAYGAWVNVNNVGLSIWETPEQMGFAHGDEFTIGFMSLPEYYENGGALDAEQMVKLMASGKIGEGAYHSYTFTVDENAPVVEQVEKDPETGALIVTARDDQYIAAVAVLNAKGSNVLTMVGADQSEAGETVTTTVDMTDVSVNRDCMVMVADYAGNESYYMVTGYNEGINNYAGRMYGFSNTVTRGSENSWMEIEPDKLHYYTDDLGEVFQGGTADVANMPWTVVAAEYVGGHVFMATDTGCLYVAEQGDWENASIVAENKNYAKIKDMAYDTASGTLYALIGSANTIYSVDLVDGTLTKEYTVSVTFPKTVADANYELLAMTIDDEGNFYAVNNGDANYKRVYLFTWNASDRIDGTGNVKNLAPVNNTTDGFLGDYFYNDNYNYMGDACIQSMAWDHDNDILYYAAAMSPVSPNNILFTIDTATGKAANATGPIDGVAEYYLGVLSCNTSGLYIVPTETGSLPEADTATGITLERSKLNLLEGSEYTIHADVFPWNLVDKTVLWTSSDENVATVDGSGTVTALTAGEAVITATTAAQPGVSASCTVTVEAVKHMELKGLLYDAEGKSRWVTFNTADPAAWTTDAECGRAFQAGGFLEDTLYVHDGNLMYSVDANTFEVTNRGYADPTWLWTDAAPAPVNENGYFGRIVGVLNGGRSLGVMDIKTATASELPHYYLFKNDHAAVIAFKGATTHTDEYGTYPAYEYYVLTEQGTLMLMTTFAFYDGDAGAVMYDDVIETIGETGLRLTGVSEVGSGKNGSMYYDAARDYLIVAANNSSETVLYAFQPDACAPTVLGTFGADVWPVVSLYTYAPYSELTVTVDPAKAELYIDETVQLEAKVYQYVSSDAVIWSSSDESVAVVDDNGLVTAVGAGKATITATAAEGSASASAQITVKPLDTLDVQLHAYITTEDGGQWVSIDGNDMTVEVLSTSDAFYTGAAVADGKIYATDYSSYYEIDPQNGYAVVEGDNFTDGDGAACLYMLDGSSAPKTELTLPDLNTDEEVTVEMGGTPVYLSGYDGNGYHYLTMLKDFTTGEYAVSPIAYTYNPAAVAYHYSEIIDTYYAFDFYLVLGYDGLLESYSLYSSVAGGEVYTAGGWELDTVNTGLTFDDGDDVSMVYVSTDAFDGVIISHADANGVSLYSFDLNTHALGKLGFLPQASDLVGLSLMSEVGGTDEPEEPVIPDVPAQDQSMLGYLALEEGYAWAKIDPSTGAYEVLAEDTVDYTGGGYANGMIYTSYGVSKYGQTTYSYYAIDPINGFGATAGGTCTGFGYAMADGTGTPAVTVNLGGTNVNAGGYYVYAANGPYSSSTPKVYVLKNYASSTTTEPYVSSSSFSGKLAAISFIGGTVSEDGLNYLENFLILGQNGTLYSYQLVTNTSGLYAAANVSTIGTLDLTAMDGAAMALADEDTIMLSVNADDGVVFYSYTVSTGELTELGTVSDAVKLGNLVRYADVYGEPEQPEEPEIPDEPVDPEPTVETSLLGYLAVEDGYAWAKIDPASGAYEVLAEDTVDYTGGGYALMDERIFTTYGVSKYGQTTYTYYQIDPANGFAAAAGKTCPGFGYVMADGTSTPYSSVELFDEASEAYLFADVGGYFVYVANGPYSSSAPKVYVLSDFGAGEYTEPYISSSTFSGKLAAITYVGSRVSGDELSAFEDFLILGQNGTMYSMTLTTTVEGLYAAANVSSLGMLDLSAMDGASMTLVDADTVMISVNADDGVVLYSYTISTGELTELSVIADAVKLSCMSIYDEAVPALERMITGSTLSVDVSGEVSTDKQTVTVKLSEDVVVTNGRMEISFDPEAMTYVGASSMNALYVVNDTQAAEGRLVISYASGAAIEAGTVIAALRFAYEGTLGTDVTVTVTARNGENGLNESETIRLGEARILAEGWSGYTTWKLTEDGVLTVSPSGQLWNGKCNMANYWKQDGVLTLPWGEYADRITTVVIEEGVHAVGQMAFYELPNLTTVILPESMQEIRNYAFKNDTALSSINLENVTNICEGAFYGCSSLTDVAFAPFVIVGDWAFTRSGIIYP